MIFYHKGVVNVSTGRGSRKTLCARVVENHDTTTTQLNDLRQLLVFEMRIVTAEGL